MILLGRACWAITKSLQIETSNSQIKLSWYQLIFGPARRSWYMFLLVIEMYFQWGTNRVDGIPWREASNKQSNIHIYINIDGKTVRLKRMGRERRMTVRIWWGWEKNECHLTMEFPQNCGLVQPHSAVREPLHWGPELISTPNEMTTRFRKILAMSQIPGYPWNPVSDPGDLVPSIRVFQKTAGLL